MQFSIVGAILERFAKFRSSSADLALLRAPRRVTADFSTCNAEILELSSEGDLKFRACGFLMYLFRHSQRGSSLLFTPQRLHTEGGSHDHYHDSPPLPHR